MIRIVTYGLGGHDESKPNNNIISIEEFPDDFDSDSDAQHPASDIGSDLGESESADA
jgi:hypothetical protein